MNTTPYWLTTEQIADPYKAIAAFCKDFTPLESRTYLWEIIKGAVMFNEEGIWENDCCTHRAFSLYERLMQLMEAAYILQERAEPPDK